MQNPGAFRSKKGWKLRRNSPPLTIRLGERAKKRSNEKQPIGRLRRIQDAGNGNFAAGVLEVVLHVSRQHKKAEAILRACLPILVLEQPLQIGKPLQILFRHLVNEADPGLGNDPALGYLVFHRADETHAVLAVQVLGNKPANELPTSAMMVPGREVSRVEFSRRSEGTEGHHVQGLRMWLTARPSP